ncbi:MAG: hypothetical protein EAZ78_13295 [Oscillatoriales cyanobacterium]|nr:MAG: hypothetical protein EA000_26310 [Oscillatoriales cyanobacterium]TAD93267.1 MAG: hypothetical protein EAZ98_23425 [Oscillatoriales cyanobacterium]TAE00801.1 MAG: hypothetical protein EAZ96_20520 [Oscillatoriales cyanobacterium]TAF03138.1 MAG: hypothetical protein EAZ78_13295 [Oscillatoriales cyanobacterium]TAF45549.1 MAG: hypothetical protein EAZ68_04855 [Oscillatoriales cyanobacterium]
MSGSQSGCFIYGLITVIQQQRIAQVVAMPYPDYVSFGKKNINNTFYFASRLDFNHCPSVFPYYWISPGFNSK